MKKILSIFAAVSLLAVLVLPAVSLAIPLSGTIPSSCTITNQAVSDSVSSCVMNAACDPSANVDCGVCCMLNTVYTVTNWIFYILTLVAVLMIIYGGFTYIAAAGDPAKATKGKTVLTLSIIGLAIALLAKFVPALVKFVLGM